jgi:hypothetical protein
MSTKGRGRGPDITLRDGPYNNLHFWEEDFLEQIHSAQRMSRTYNDVRGWALGYERPPNGTIWTWRGRGCYPSPPD